MLRNLFLLVLLGYSSVGVASELHQTAFDYPPEYELVVSAIEKLKEITVPVWGDYRPENYAYGLADMRKPDWVQLFFNDKSNLVHLNSKLNEGDGNPGFWKFGLKEPLYNAPDEVKTWVRDNVSIEQDYIVIMDVSFDLLRFIPSLSSSIFPAEQFKTPVIAATFSHESFHFHQQLCFTSCNEKWPKWEQSMDSDGSWIDTVCYGLEEKEGEIHQLFKEEHAALLMAVLTEDLSPTKRDQLLQTFIQKRLKRYELLQKVKTENGNSCEEVEAKMEFFEGVPEYVGFGSVLEVGMLHPHAVRDYIISQDSNHYYSFGFLQLLALKKFSSKPMSVITEELSRSTSARESIFLEFMRNFSTRSE